MGWTEAQFFLLYFSFDHVFSLTTDSQFYNISKSNLSFLRVGRSRKANDCNGLCSGHGKIRLCLYWPTNSVWKLNVHFGGN